MIPGRSQNRRLRDVGLIVALLAVVIAGLIGMAAATGWQETLDQVSKLSLAQVGILLGLSLLSYLARAVRWHLFARRLNTPTTLIGNLRHFLGGFAMLVTPGRVGELVRMHWIRRETGWGLEKSAPLLLIDRASDLAAMALLLAMGLMLSAKGIAGAVPVAAIALLAAFVATRPRLMSYLTGLGYRVLGVWPRLFARVRMAARSLGRFTNPSFMTLTMVIGLIAWVIEGYEFHLLLTWMGADIGFATAMCIFMFATIVGGVTGAPGGLGGAEAAMIGLLTLQNVPLEISIPATAIIRLTTLWFAILVGVVIFPVAERQSIKVRDALENY